MRCIFYGPLIAYREDAFVDGPMLLVGMVSVGTIGPLLHPVQCIKYLYIVYYSINTIHNIIVNLVQVYNFTYS